jgi:hypothetical protein
MIHESYNDLKKVIGYNIKKASIEHYEDIFNNLDEYEQHKLLRIFTIILRKVDIPSEKIETFNCIKENANLHYPFIACYNYFKL